MRAATSGAMLELFRMSLRPPGLRGRHASRKKPATNSRAFCSNGDGNVGQRTARPVVGVGAALSAVRVVRGVRTLS